MRLQYRKKTRRARWGSGSAALASAPKQDKTRTTGHS